MSTYGIGGTRSMRTCAYDGEGGSSFCHFGAYVLIEWPLIEQSSIKYFGSNVNKR